MIQHWHIEHGELERSERRWDRGFCPHHWNNDGMTAEMLPVKVEFSSARFALQVVWRDKTQHHGARLQCIDDRGIPRLAWWNAVDVAKSRHQPAAP